MSINRPERDAIIESLRKAEWPKIFGRDGVPPGISIDQFKYHLVCDHGFVELAIVGFSQAKLGEPIGRMPGRNVLILALPFDFPELVAKNSELSFDESCHHIVLLRKPSPNDEKLLCNHLVVEPLVVNNVDGLNLSVDRVNPAAAASFAIMA